ncbi:MAG TPA: hypothetical protein VFF52_29235 [Isosphaeraceae bacterium]|nr:hypothetical protein [Isosphaeraceae bacterium]
MNQAVRHDLLRILSELCDHAPDLGFGQLIANLAFLARASGPSDVYDVEDEELLEAARSHLLDLERRSDRLASSNPA